MENREIDKLVAEKLMGYTVDERPELNQDHCLVIKPNDTSIGGIFYIERFCPSTNIQDTWLILNELNKKGFYFQIEQESDFTYVVYIQDGYYEETITKSALAESESLPMAICLAALKIRDKN